MSGHWRVRDNRAAEGHALSLPARQRIDPFRDQRMHAHRHFVDVGVESRRRKSILSKHARDHVGRNAATRRSMTERHAFLPSALFAKIASKMARPSMPP